MGFIDGLNLLAAVITIISFVLSFISVKSFKNNNETRPQIDTPKGFVHKCVRSGISAFFVVFMLFVAYCILMMLIEPGGTFWMIFAGLSLPYSFFMGFLAGWGKYRSYLQSFVIREEMLRTYPSAIRNESAIYRNYHGWLFLLDDKIDFYGYSKKGKFEISIKLDNIDLVIPQSKSEVVIIKKDKKSVRFKDLDSAYSWASIIQSKKHDG